MTPLMRPRGPLPGRVYWTRRLLVLAVGLVLVFGVTRLLGGGGGTGPSARPVAADPTGGTPTPTTTLPPTPATTVTGPATGRTPTDLPTPSGSCASRDVVATPSVAGPAYAGRPVVLTMTLTTRSTPACTWVVSPGSLVVEVTWRGERFWSTQDCRGAVGKQSVVVRRDSPTTVAIPWNALRSDSECSRSTAWAEPGYYHVVGAALGADPTDVAFRLLRPVRETITATPTPTPTPSPTSSPTRTGPASRQR